MFIILGKRDDMVQYVRDTAHAEHLMAQPGRNLRHIALAAGRHAVAWEEYSTITWALNGDKDSYTSALAWCADNAGWTVYRFPDWINDDEITQRHSEVKRKLSERSKPVY